MDYYYNPDTQNKFGKNTLENFEKNDKFKYQCNNIIIVQSARQLLYTDPKMDDEIFKKEGLIIPITFH